MQPAFSPERMEQILEAVESRLMEFCWGQWAQLGVSADITRRDSWAADPEALLIFTLEVARGDPRLFDEVLDWIRVNGRLLVRQRLQNLTRDDEEGRHLTDAAMSWASAHGSSVRWPPGKKQGTTAEPKDLFVFSGRPFRGELDPHFRRFGFRRPPAKPSEKSRPPDPKAPVAFAFRMRELFGLKSRAEIVRFLITNPPNAEFTALEIAEAVAFAKRNVTEALNSLVAGGLVTARWRGNERAYRFDRSLLAVPEDEVPRYVAWPQLFRALLLIVRWLAAEAALDRSEYMRGSEARRLLDSARPDLEAAGITIRGERRRGAEHWANLVDTLEEVLQILRA